MTDFTIPDMSCGHCVQAITDAITSQDTMANVTVDLKNKTVSIQSRLEDAEARQILTQAGYPPLV